MNKRILFAALKLVFNLSTWCACVGVLFLIGGKPALLGLATVAAVLSLLLIWGFAVERAWVFVAYPVLLLFMAAGLLSNAITRLRK